MTRRLEKTFLALALAGLLLSGLALPAKADTMLNFGAPTPNANIFEAINPTASTTTIETIGGVYEAVTITAYAGSGAPAVPFTAYFLLSMTSINQASGSVGPVTQDFNGSFSFNSKADGSGTNYLSGSFTDLTFGVVSASSANISASQPPETVAFHSDLIPASVLSYPEALSFSLSNVIPPFAVNGSAGPPDTLTIAAFQSTGTGTFSATPVPEPSTMAIAGLGALGMIGYGLRRRKALGA